MREQFDYLRPETDEWEKVDSHSWFWRWKAVYNDGFVFYQCNEANGRFHQMREIQYDKLQELIIYAPTKDHEFRLFISDGMKPIFFAKRGVVHIPMNENDEDSEDAYAHAYTFYIFGYEIPAEKKKVLHTIDQEGNFYILPETEAIKNGEIDPWYVIAHMQGRRIAHGGK